MNEPLQNKVSNLLIGYGLLVKADDVKSALEGLLEEFADTILDLEYVQDRAMHWFPDLFEKGDDE